MIGGTGGPMAYEGPRSYRSVIMGRRGAVASNHPLATQAGLLALQAGGNAVDAAGSVAATLSGVEPLMAGLGGRGLHPAVVRRTRGAGGVHAGPGWSTARGGRRGRPPRRAPEPASR